MSKLASIAAAVLLLAACGGGPAGTPGEVASPSPAATRPAVTVAPPTATPVPTNAAGVRTCPSSSDGPERVCVLEAGIYATAFQTPGFTYTVPSAGWGSLDREVSPGNFHLFPPGSSMAGFQNGTGDVITVIVSAVAPGHCTGAPSTTVPATFAGLLDFLTSHPNLNVGGVKDAAAGGLDGKVLDVTYAKSDGCVDGAYVDLYVGVGRSHGQFGIPPTTASMRLFLLHVPGNDRALVIEIDDGKGGGSDYGDGEDWYKVAQDVVDSFAFSLDQ
jgi:hypothetical protein